MLLFGHWSLHDVRSPRVRIEPMTPGTLMLFNGRNSMHQVSRIEGAVPRYVALLSYDTKPGTDSTRTLKLNRYGRLREHAIGAVTS